MLLVRMSLVASKLSKCAAAQAALTKDSVDKLIGLCQRLLIVNSEDLNCENHTSKCVTEAGNDEEPVKGKKALRKYHKDVADEQSRPKVSSTSDTESSR